MDFWLTITLPPSLVVREEDIYDNICKCIQFLLSSNLAEVISVFLHPEDFGFTILQPTHLLDYSDHRLSACALWLPRRRPRRYEAQTAS